MNHVEKSIKINRKKKEDRFFFKEIDNVINLFAITEELGGQTTNNVAAQSALNSLKNFMLKLSTSVNHISKLFLNADQIVSDPTKKQINFEYIDTPLFQKPILFICSVNDTGGSEPITVILYE